MTSAESALREREGVKLSIARGGGHIQSFNRNLSFTLCLTLSETLEGLCPGPSDALNHEAVFTFLSTDILVKRDCELMSPLPKLKRHEGVYKVGWLIL